MLDDADSEATKDEKWLKTYQKSNVNHIWALVVTQASEETTFNQRQWKAWALTVLEQQNFPW